MKAAREPIATWYQLTRYRMEIVPVQAVSFTEKTVTIWNGHREERNNLHSDYYDFYPTWEQAHEALSARWKQNAKNAESTLADARYKVEQIAAMKPPA
jgi:hypothetical protein